MKFFTKHILRNLALSVLSAAALSACGGGSCANCNTASSSNLTLSIAAPSQYPAGIATTVYLTMTNTSNVNGTNLVYSVPAPGELGNYTGVVITTDANGAGQNCANILAGESCTFTATIPAGSKPGSFTVTATPNGSSSQSATITTAGKSLQAGSISVTANLGLVDIPTTNNDYYVLPSDQVITGSATQATTAYVSVLVKKVGDGLNSLKLVDEAGVELSYTPVGTPSYTLNSVNSYKVIIPAGKTIQHIQALSNTCTTVNIGTNDSSACSNDADVNLVSQGNGILSVQPNQFNMSTSYESQVITLTNTGTGTVNNIVYPDWASLGQGQFTLSENNCASFSKLSAGQSCTITLRYTANTTSGAITPVFNYDDDNNSGTEPKNTEIIIPYTGTLPATPFSVLTIQPSSVSLSESSSRRVLTITNTVGGNTAGVTIPAGWTLPNLASPLEFESTNCYNLPDGLYGFALTTKALSVGDSCIYTIKYSNAESAGQTSLAFTYNNGIASGQVTNVAVDWSALVSVAPTITILSIPNPVGSVMMGGGFQFTAMLSGTGSSTVSAEFANPAAGIITSDLSPCALASTGVTSCTFTVMTAWDTSLANSLDNLAYQINISATNSVSVTGSPVSYTELTPTVYLPQTGQTPTAPITATAGMDGYVHAGIPWAYATSGTTTPATRFTVGTDAEANCVTDNLTGLMWVKSLASVTVKGALSGSPTTWQNALDSVATANSGAGYCGYKDWYLPTVNDLASLLNAGFSAGDKKQNTWLNEQGFSSVQPDRYWSSSTSTSYDNSALYVNFDTSVVSPNGIGFTGRVWPVRRPSGVVTAPAKVAKTGESGGATGADNGVAWPSSRFAAGNGAAESCISDKLTGLMWPKNGIIGFEVTDGGGPIAQPDYTNATTNLNTLNWSNALTAVANMNSAPIKLCGYSDWRLPNRVELKSMVNYGAANPASWLMYGTGNSGAPVCDGACFVNVQANEYWSSSTVALNIIGAWFVDFNYGRVSADDKASNYYVWPVRGGQ
ncbi:MAG: DUF1566 domain-containing protein [Burkholderiales bacterium]|nr:DUF1566 domain-containing protein [Burkholderiales bacterium]